SSNQMSPRVKARSPPLPFVDHHDLQGPTLTAVEAAAKTHGGPVTPGAITSHAATGSVMIRFIPLGGFLGAGKTTTMLAAARLLERGGERVSLITNDQGTDLVDTQLARAAGFAGVGEITGGCFCCRFEDLASVVQRLADQVNPTVVIAEAVGSCTDLQSTVVRPLRRLYGDQLHTASLTVTLDPVRHAAIQALARQAGGETDLAYLYRHQLDEAD